MKEIYQQAVGCNPLFYKERGAAAKQSGVSQLHAESSPRYITLTWFVNKRIIIASKGKKYIS